MDPVGLNLGLVDANRLRANVTHQHAGVLQKCRQSWGNGLVAQVGWNWAAEDPAAANVKLGAMHGASDDFAIERSQFQRRIHVSAAPLNGVEGAAAIADDDLVSVELDGFHPAERDLIRADRGNKLVTQGPRPLVAVEAGCRGP
jgi:hypothetical protein